MTYKVVKRALCGVALNNDGSFERCLKNESGDWEDTDYSNIRYDDNWDIVYYSYPKNFDYSGTITLNSNGGFVWFGSFRCPYLVFKTDSVCNREITFTNQEEGKNVCKPGIIGSGMFRIIECSDSYILIYTKGTDKKD